MSQYPFYYLLMFRKVDATADRPPAPSGLALSNPRMGPPAKIDYHQYFSHAGSIHFHQAELVHIQTELDHHRQCLASLQTEPSRPMVPPYATRSPFMQYHTDRIEYFKLREVGAKSNLEGHKKVARSFWEALDIDLKYKDFLSVEMLTYGFAPDISTEPSSPGEEDPLDADDEGEDLECASEVAVGRLRSFLAEWIPDRVRPLKKALSM